MTTERVVRGTIEPGWPDNDLMNLSHDLMRGVDVVVGWLFTSSQSCSLTLTVNYGREEKPIRKTVEGVGAAGH